MSTLAVAILSGIIGALIGVMLGRLIDPMHQQHQQQSTTLKKAQQELEDLRNQVKEHFTHTAASLQQLNDSTRAAQNQLAMNAMRISGLDLHPAETSGSEEVRLARLLTGEATLPPRDYAPKSEDDVGTLSEEYGLKDDDYSPRPVRG